MCGAGGKATFVRGNGCIYMCVCMYVCLCIKTTVILKRSIEQYGIPSRFFLILRGWKGSCGMLFHSVFMHSAY